MYQKSEFVTIVHVLDIIKYLEIAVGMVIIVDLREAPY